MDLDTVISRLKTDLAWYGAFNSDTAQNRLKSAILAGCSKIWHAHDWPWKFKTATITTTEGTKGPYDPPSDYHTMVKPLRSHFLGYGDEYVLYTIKPTPNEAWVAVYDEIEGKFYFANDPGDNTHTLGYIPQFENNLDTLVVNLVNYPEELFDALQSFVTAHLLNKPDTKQEARAYDTEGFALLQPIWAKYVKGRSKPKGIEPRGINWQTIHNIASPEPVHPYTGG